VRLVPKESSKGECGRVHAKQSLRQKEEGRAFYGIPSTGPQNSNISTTILAGALDGIPFPPRRLQILATRLKGNEVAQRMNTRQLRSLPHPGVFKDASRDKKRNFRKSWYSCKIRIEVVDA